MTLGQQLREARTRKGVSIEAAAEDTKVKADTLRALEADDYSKIAAPVYAKGFLKIYAEYLGLDTQNVRDQYVQASGAASPASAPLHKAAALLHQSPVDRIISSIATMWHMWLLVGAILIVLLLIVWIVIAATRGDGDRASRETRTGSVSQHIPPPKPSVQASPSVPPPTNAVPTSADAYVRPVQPKPAMLDAGKPGSARGTTEMDTVASAPLSLSVRLVEDCWIEVVLDGKTTLPYSIKKTGWTNEWHAQQSITLKVGNAAGVQAKLNGRDLGRLGQRNKTFKKTFTR